MSLTWIIVRKDLFRLRWILLLWAVVSTGGSAWALIQADLTRTTYYPFYIATLVVKLLFLPVFTVGAVMGLIDDDAAADSDAFWVTRPISGARLLASKLIGLAIVWWVPVLAQLPWWLSRDFHAAQIMRAAGQVLFLQCGLSVLVFPLAVISPNGSRFVWSLMVAFAAAGLLWLAFQFGGGPPSPITPFAESLSGRPLVAVVWLAGIVLVAGNQFLFRRTKRSVVIFAATIVACFAAHLLFEKARMTAGLEAPRLQPTKPIVGTDSVLELPAAVGAVVTRAGARIKIQELVYDPFSNRCTVVVSDSGPLLDPDFGAGLLTLPSKESPPGSYYLTNPRDGKSVPALSQPAGETLHFSSVKYTHLELNFPLSVALAGSSPAEIAAWLKQATVLRRSSPLPAASAAMPVTHL